MNILTVILGIVFISGKLITAFVSQIISALVFSDYFIIVWQVVLWHIKLRLMPVSSFEISSDIINLLVVKNKEVY